MLLTMRVADPGPAYLFHLVGRECGQPCQVMFKIVTGTGKAVEIEGEKPVRALPAFGLDDGPLGPVGIPTHLYGPLEVTSLHNVDNARSYCLGDGPLQTSP